MSCCAGPIVGDAATANADASLFQRVNELRASGRRMPDGTVQYIMSVPGIHCGACITTIESALSDVTGVVSTRVNLSLRRVVVTLVNEEVSPLHAVQEIESRGYKVFVLEEQAQAQADRDFGRLVKSLAVAGFAAANIMLLSVSVWTGAEGAARDMFHFISALIAIPAVAYAGQPFFRSAINALRSGRMNMDVPISLGVTLALGMSMWESFHGGHNAYFDAAVTLLFFLLIGRTLDHMMRERAREAVKSLGKLSAKGGLVIEQDGTLSYTPLDEIVPGMTLRVPAGERIPVDCEVIEGASDIDKSLVTGESKPVHAAMGTALEAGTLNLTGPVDVRALRPASQSFLADVQQMMQAAEHGRGSYVRLADRVSRMYAPVVHVLALISFLGWMIYSGGDWHTSLTVAVAVLIITCPCALGLAVPVAHVVSASKLFEAGILMKDGAALERMAQIDHAAFDKTGTLTTGEPQVLATSIPEGPLAAVAKALAERSSHPASRALADHFQNGGSESIDAIVELPGLGMEGQWQGKLARVGRPSWVAEIAQERATEPAAGIGFAVAGSPMYSATLREQLRDDAATTLQALASSGIASEILSGDAPAAVESIAIQLPVAGFLAGVRPGDKLARLEQAKTDGQHVLMVGDGVNDAPALAAAHVSMAPASAAEVGRMAADFVFTRDSLSAVSTAFLVSRRARSIVLQNFGLAIVYNVFAVPLAMAGYLNPFIAAVAMSSSSIIVVANSLRLYGIKVPGTARRSAGDHARPARLRLAPGT